MLIIRGIAMSGKNSDEARPTTEYGTSRGLFGETDRESGEYRFRSGYTQQVYSNAHFVPVDESTSPPKYYRPVSRNSSDASKGSKSRQKKAGMGFAAVLLLCFLCGILGGVFGTFAYTRYLQGAELKQASEAAQPEEALLAQESESGAFMNTMGEPSEYRASFENEDLSPSEIYDLACSQVVSVSVEMVSYDMFGNQTPSVISGSGFVFTEDGYILTNYHVIEKAVKNNLNVTIGTYDKSVYVGRIVGVEEDQDLAVIKIDKDGFVPVVFGDSDDMKVGDNIFAVGNPYGILEFTMTMGHISALDRQIATEETENSLSMFQIDAAVYSGNSGGPVYDSQGRVVGIVTAKYASSGMEGIGFALPINRVLPVVTELVDKGYVSGKASLGVSFDNRYNTVYSRYYRLPEGAFVSSVQSGSCAEKAGISPGDILMRIGEYSIEDYADVPAALRHFSAGESADVSIYRESKILTLTVCFDEAVPSVSQNTSRITYYSFYRNY